MNENVDAKRWVKLKKVGISAVSDARTQFQNRVKDYFIRRWDDEMWITVCQFGN